MRPERRPEPKGRRLVRTWHKWLIAAIVAGAIGVTAGPYVYIHFIEGKAPAPLSVSSPTQTTTATAASGSVDGTWSVSSGSVVGYRVKEVLFGQSNTASAERATSPARRR
jgi:hypothetical protein